MRETKSSHNIFEQLRNLQHDEFTFISSGTEQTNPHLINCNNDTVKDPFCEDGVSPRFCEGKVPGTYAHPSFCNKIIYCSNAGQNVETCQDGTGFNPHFLNCDWPGFLRCVDIRRGMYIFKSIKWDLLFLRSTRFLCVK